MCSILQRSSKYIPLFRVELSCITTIRNRHVERENPYPLPLYIVRTSWNYAKEHFLPKQVKSKPHHLGENTIKAGGTTNGAEDPLESA